MAALNLINFENEEEVIVCDWCYTHRYVGCNIKAILKITEGEVSCEICRNKIRKEDIF